MSLTRPAPLFTEVPAEDGSLSVRQDPRTAWSVIGGIGALLALVGGADVVLTWVPLGLGNPEWEFGTVTATLDGMPVLSLGLALVLASALHRGGRMIARGMAIVFALLGLVVVAMAVLYLTNVPLAWRAVPDPMMRTGMGKAIMKTLVQAAAYPMVFFWLAAAGWRNTGRKLKGPVT